MTLSIYVQYCNAQFNFDKSQSLDDLNVLENVEVSYWKEVARLETIWNAFPESDRKDSAATNANETEDMDANDKISWLETAIMTYNLNP